MAAISASEAGQEQTPSRLGQPIKTTTVAVNVYAIAQGRHGKLIRNLNKDDFDLTENGIPQKIEFFSQETDAPLSLGVAIDTSVSQGHLLSTEQGAAKKFLSSVLRRGDQAFVMNFDVDVNLRQDFTNEPGKLAQAIDAAEINLTGRSILQDGPPTGGTHLFDSVYLASNELMKTRYGRKVLVLLTDGEDQGSKVTLQQAIEAAERADTIVYSIVVSEPEFYVMMGASYHGDGSVRKIARETGGRTIRVQAADQIGAAFQQIAGELRSQYLLGYSPSSVHEPLDAHGNSGFRRIHVKVRGHSYNVRTRTGYYEHLEERAQTQSLSQ